MLPPSPLIIAAFKLSYESFGFDGSPMNSMVGKVSVVTVGKALPPHILGFMEGISKRNTKETCVISGFEPNTTCAYI